MICCRSSAKPERRFFRSEPVAAGPRGTLGRHARGLSPARAAAVGAAEPISALAPGKGAPPTREQRTEIAAAPSPSAATPPTAAMHMQDVVAGRYRVSLGECHMDRLAD